MLNNNNLSGDVPESFFQSDSLSEVDLSYNYLSDSPELEDWGDWKIEEYNRIMPSQKSARKVA